MLNEGRVSQWRLHKGTSNTAETSQLSEYKSRSSWMGSPHELLWATPFDTRGEWGYWSQPSCCPTSQPTVCCPLVSSLTPSLLFSLHLSSFIECPLHATHYFRFRGVKAECMLTMSLIVCVLMLWHLGPCWLWRGRPSQGQLLPRAVNTLLASALLRYKPPP